MPRWTDANTQPCGTYQAYRRHLDNGEPPCGPCRRENAHRSRLGRRRRKARIARLEYAAATTAAYVPPAAVMVTDVMALLDLCEATDRYDSYGDRREYLLDLEEAG